MPDDNKPIAIDAASVPPSRAGRGYPEPFAARVAGRERGALGDVFGLTNFGVISRDCHRAACRRCATLICARTNSSISSRANPFS